VLGIGLNSRCTEADFRVEQTPVGEGVQRSRHGEAHFGAPRRAGRPRAPNDKRGTASETAYGCTKGKSSGGCNPTSGSGMKQGRQARGG
jgi:hypothetical protein